MRLVTGARSVQWAPGALVILGVGLAGAAAPAAAADPAPPVEPVVSAPVVPVASAPAPGDPAPAVQASAVQAAASVPAAPADGVSHLPSPDSLPPGTTQTAPEHPTLGYLKDVWNALKTEEVSASDALLLLAQRPVDNARVADSVPQSQSVPAAPPAGEALRPTVGDAAVPPIVPPAPAPAG